MKKLSDNQHPATGRLEDVFREQFAQAEAEPRVSLWDRIEQDLDSGQVQVYKKKTVLYQRLAAACAALLLLFGAYAFYQELSDRPAEEPVQQQPVISEEMPVQTPDSKEDDQLREVEQAALGASAAQAAIEPEPGAAVEKERAPVATTLTAPETEPAPVRQTEATPAAEQSAPAESKPEEKTVEAEPSEKASRPEITVNRSAMNITVDAPVTVALGRTVTVRSLPCATGLFGELWLQLENGRYLQPVEDTSGKKLKEGNRYQIDYEILNGAGTPIAEDCISPLPEASPVKITRLKAQ